MTKATPRKARRPIGPTVDDLVRGYQREIEQRAEELERVLRRESAAVRERDNTITAHRETVYRLNQVVDTLQRQLAATRRREQRQAQSIKRLEAKRDDLLTKLNKEKPVDADPVREWRRHKNQWQRKIVQSVQIPAQATQRQIYQAIEAVVRDNRGELPDGAIVRALDAHTVRVTVWVPIDDVHALSTYVPPRH